MIAACALKALGGAIQGRLWPRNDDERTAALDAGYDLTAVLTTDDLVSGDDVFFSATGITDGDLLKRRALLGRRRQHRDPRHALEVGHDPQDPGHAPLAEAHALLVPEVRLSLWSSLTAAAGYPPRGRSLLRSLGLRSLTLAPPRRDRSSP